MKTKKNLLNLFYSILLLVLFILLTILAKTVDYKPIGPNSSSVGLASINQKFHDLTGVHLTFYNITDWLGLVPIFVMFFFAILGLIMWIKRKSILKVDSDILVLGAYYIVLIFLYFLFEKVVINYRPVLINGILEASYPSSTTLLVLAVMLSAIPQIIKRIKNSRLKKILIALAIGFTLFMVVGRLISGVHWLTDIIGGLLLSSWLAVTNYLILNFLENKKNDKNKSL